MSFSAVSEPRSVAQINITPLVDVMLVLLVIFMIATPMMSQAIPYTIPQTGPDTPKRVLPEPIALRIDASGEVFVGGEPVALSSLQATLRSRAGSDASNQPSLWIDANADSDYDTVAKVLAAANNAGLARVGFVRD